MPPRRHIWFVVDVEADGPCPGLYSMYEFGAVLCSDPSVSFHGKLRPVSERFDLAALAVRPISREETMSFPDPKGTMEDFFSWVRGLAPAGDRAMFVSDNNGYDWQWINYYFHRFLDCNPFGHSSTNLGSLYKGMVRDMTKSFKHLRVTKHTHNPVDDARGNAEALLYMREQMKLVMPFEAAF